MWRTFVVCKEFDSGEISGQAQSLAPDSHPSMWWPRSWRSPIHVVTTLVKVTHPCGDHTRDGHPSMWWPRNVTVTHPCGDHARDGPARATETVKERGANYRNGRSLGWCDGRTCGHAGCGADCRHAGQTVAVSVWSTGGTNSTCRPPD